jgi:hypothetical protein
MKSGFLSTTGYKNGQKVVSCAAIWVILLQLNYAAKIQQAARVSNYKFCQKSVVCLHKKINRQDFRIDRI